METLLLRNLINSQELDAESPLELTLTNLNAATPRQLERAAVVLTNLAELCRARVERLELEAADPEEVQAYEWETSSRKIERLIRRLPAWVTVE